MGQDIILLLLFIVVAYIINGMRKSHKHEVKPIQPPKAPNSRGLHVKTTPIKPQETVAVWEKEDSLLPKSSNSRSKRMLNRSCLRQSILISEILSKKY